MQRIAGAIERLLREGGTPQEIETQLRALTAELQPMLTALRALPEPAVEPSVAVAGATEGVLEHLDALLESHDMEATRFAREAAGDLAAALGHDLAEQLAAEISRVDFTAALATLRQAAPA